MRAHSRHVPGGFLQDCKEASVYLPERARNRRCKLPWSVQVWTGKGEVEGYKKQLQQFSFQLNSGSPFQSSFCTCGVVLACRVCVLCYALECLCCCGLKARSEMSCRRKWCSLHSFSLPLPKSDISTTQFCVWDGMGLLLCFELDSLRSYTVDSLKHDESGVLPISYPPVDGHRAVCGTKLHQLLYCLRLLLDNIISGESHSSRCCCSLRGDRHLPLPSTF